MNGPWGQYSARLPESSAAVWAGARNEAVSRQDIVGFRLVLVYLFIEYVRPMDFVPLLEMIRPGLLINLFLMVSWVTSGSLARVFDGSRQMKLVWALLIVMAVLVPFAHNNRFAFNTTLSVLLYLPFMLSVILYVNSFARMKTFLTAWVVILVILAIKGILFKGKGGSSFLSDENDFSLLMNMMMPFAYGLYLWSNSKGRRLVYLGAVLLGVLSVVASFSRGGFVGLLVVGAVIWWFSPRKFMALLVIGLLGVVVVAGTGQEYWQEMGTISNTSEGTARDRIDSWKAGWAMFIDNPLGVGPGNFPVNFQDYQEGLSFKRGMWGRVAHSLWFTLLPELGVVGTVIYCALIRANLQDIVLFRRGQDEKSEDGRLVYCLGLAFAASLAGFFASGTFLSVLYYPHFFYVTAMIVATRKIAGRRE